MVAHNLGWRANRKQVFLFPYPENSMCLESRGEDGPKGLRAWPLAPRAKGTSFLASTEQ